MQRVGSAAAALYTVAALPAAAHRLSTVPACVRAHREPRYTDTRDDEQTRGLSIKSCPVSLVLPSAAGKSFLVNVVDTPGHVNFEAEAAAAMRACDGAVLVVDAVEGVMMQTERLARIALAEGLSVCLVINKVSHAVCAATYACHVYTHCCCCCCCS